MVKITYSCLNKMSKESMPSGISEKKLLRLILIRKQRFEKLFWFHRYGNLLLAGKQGKQEGRKENFGVERLARYSEFTV
jgi:hypothetical protein